MNIVFSSSWYGTKVAVEEIDCIKYCTNSLVEIAFFFLFKLCGRMVVQLCAVYVLLIWNQIQLRVTLALVCFPSAISNFLCSQIQRVEFKDVGAWSEQEVCM